MQKARLLPVLSVWVLALGLVCSLRGATPAFVWFESESARTGFPAIPSHTARPHFLSASNWLQLAVDAEQVEAKVPAEGVTLDYPFTVTQTGRYAVWNRVGFEFARSPFEWRVDNGAWQSITPEALTTDLMELGTWTEVAWLRMGEQELSPGEHRLQIRVTRAKDDQGKWRRFLYASDALCLVDGEFLPNSKFKPDESGRTAADEAAGKIVFQLPTAKPSQRASVKLGGVWEIARDDEELPGEVAAPIRALPQHPVWRAIPVPGDKNVLREDLVFAHRIWYRTRVAVPKEMKGRAFCLDFPGNNLNTTVYVNGVLCGFEKNPFVPFSVDVTRAVKPGQVNEICVGIRDSWYGRSADPSRPLKLRRTFNLPASFISQGFQDLDYPIWNCPQSGLLGTPTFTAAGGAVAVADVFVKPFVVERQLAAEITVNNSSGKAVTGEIGWEAVNDQNGQVERTFKPVPFQLAGGQTQTFSLTNAWADPKLWWPDTPNLYRLRTTVRVGRKAVDVQETTFGFREWRIAGTKFTLNGVVWHLWADLVGSKPSPEAWLSAYRATYQRLMRLSTAGQAGHDTRWLGLEPQAALEFFDRNGVVVRRNTTLDGEAIGYQFSEGDPETRRRQGGSELKLTLMRNWRDQCLAQVRGERNHPSIHLWTIENEFAFINLINLLGNSPNMDRYEAEIARTHDAVRALDPTRPVMIDGGGALKNNSLSVHGDHYLATLDGRYPDLAYEPFVEGGGRGRWKWDQQRPRYLGEDFFAAGINPADYARWGGEAAFQGKAATRPAIATIYRMLNEGYRWGGHYAAWHLWLGDDGGPAQWGANQPRAVLVRQWDWTFGSAQKVRRTFGIFNDTQYAEPITFTRRLTVAGQEVYARTSTHPVAPGTADKFDEEIPMPSVVARQEAELTLTLAVGGQEVYRDTKPVSLLPAPMPDPLPAGTVAVFDPAGGTTAFLHNLGLDFLPVQSLDQLPSTARVLVVGRDALSAAESASSSLAAYAAAGRAVIVLDQTHPLHFQGLPAEMELAPRTRKDDFRMDVPASEGCTAFLENPGHPAFQSLQDKDFFTWGTNHLVFRSAYLKPTRGAKSLVQCGPRLEFSALAEVPVGQGVMYVSQLDLGGKLGVNPVAQQLLLNLIRAGSAYKLELAGVAAAMADDNLAQAVEAIGLQYTPATNALAALANPDAKIALVSATPEQLNALAANRETLEAFWQRGGTLMLCGLTPEGLADFNRIVGVNHFLRPFRRERVSFPAVRHPLTSGLTIGDLVMLSGKRIFGWTADEFVADDIFTYAVDLEDVAPFARSDFPHYDKIVNGFVGSDGWPLIIDFPAPKDGRPFEINMELPAPESITEYTHDQSLNYNLTTKIALLFDGKDRVEYDLLPNGEAATFAVNPPRPARRVTLQLVEWQADPARQPLVGIDNIALKVQRPPEWHATVKPLLNVGTMVQYVKGNGAVVLCNLKFQATEAVPVNQTKKRAILAAVLRNLKAPFAGGRTVIAGANLNSVPVDIHTKATTYKDERGWFGAARRTFKALPPGEQTFAGVKYNIYEMPTSPVPQVLMLGGNGVPGNLPPAITGIPVNARADALFFLHTARIDRRLTEREREQKVRLELCKYVIHYADGQTAELPIYSEVDIDHYAQREPQALPGAQLAWVGNFEDPGEKAVAYARQWNNPRPEVAIESVDLLPGQDAQAGVPVLLALTVATEP